MTPRSLRLAATLSVLTATASLTGPEAAGPPVVSHAQRVAARTAVERVYFGHQEGEGRTFLEAVPPALVERKVRDDLALSAALREVWGRPITAAMLETEWQRIAARTRFPGRLREIYAALDDDPLIIQECFVRPVLVRRLAREAFLSDHRIHGPAAARARALHDALVSGSLDPLVPHSGRQVVRVTAGRGRGDARPADGSLSIELPARAYAERRSRAPTRPGSVGPIEEEDEAYRIEVLLGEEPTGIQLAVYSEPRVAWDGWWLRRRDQFDPDAEPAVADASAPFPPMAVSPGGGAGALLPCNPDDTWDNGLLDDVPESRFDHSAIWTGSEMIVWGGFGGAYLNTGSRYDPLTDSWSSTSTVGAPDPRFDHTAVWTGSRMIVWGGSDGSGDLDTGASYDPSTDSWSGLATNKAPSARSGHTAVWTGTVMAIWGGTDGVSSFATGATYDPAANRWSTMATSGAPSARSGHTAVWTGSVMVVWGGTNGATALATGGRYNVAGNSWSGIATAGAPTARVDHVAAWTGGRVVIWGGDDGMAPLGGGARYDPVADAWTPLSAVGAPSARTGAAASWTGSRLVIWGGFDGSGLPPDRRALRSGRRRLVSDEHVGRPFGPGRAHGGLDRLAGHLLGRQRRLLPGARHGRPVRPRRRHLEPDARRQPAVAEIRPHGDLDRIADDRLGRDERLVRAEHRRPIRSAHRLVDADRHCRRPRRTRTAHGRLDGKPDGDLGGSSFSYLNTGARYDPIANTWSTVTTTGAPTARRGHTAVWTGSRMVIWAAPTSPS